MKKANKEKSDVNSLVTEIESHEGEMNDLDEKFMLLIDDKSILAWEIIERRAFFRCSWLYAK